MSSTGARNLEACFHCEVSLGASINFSILAFEDGSVFPLLTNWVIAAEEECLANVPNTSSVTLLAQAELFCEDLISLHSSPHRSRTPVSDVVITREQRV